MIKAIEVFFGVWAIIAAFAYWMHLGSWIGDKYGFGAQVVFEVGPILALLAALITYFH